MGVTPQINVSVEAITSSPCPIPSALSARCLPREMPAPCDEAYFTGVYPVKFVYDSGAYFTGVYPVKFVYDSLTG